jgi:penicillin-binding protein 1A
VTLPPIRDKAHPRAGDYWTPKNYDSGSSGPMTLRRALESSKNLVTANLLSGITAQPEESLARICGLALEAQLYGACVRHYPFVLGAQPVRLLDLAAFYAAISNEGALPAPYAIESIERDGRVIYRRPAETLTWIGSADRVAFYQLKTILQGVLQRGTARAIHHLAPYVAGKTGTTDKENDAWFIGFTNDVTVAVWVGYDNADGTRRTLGAKQTGARVAVPIFQSMIEAAWAHHSPRTALSAPSPEAQRNLVARSIDLHTGDRIAGIGGQAFIEHFRTDRFGQATDTQYRLVGRQAAHAFHRSDAWFDGDWRRRPGGYGFSGLPFGQSPWWRPAPQEPHSGVWPRASARPYWWDHEERRRQQRRVDPDYFWGFR